MSKHRRSVCYILVIQTSDGLVIIVWVTAAVPGMFGGGCFFLSKDRFFGCYNLSQVLAAKAEWSAIGRLP
jgi:hypothetical protein